MHTFTSLLKHQNILLLQGPIGSFFYDLSNYLKAKGKNVHKINFNGGDNYFYPLTEDKVLEYRENLSDFRGRLFSYMDEHQIDAIVVFGDCRHYHQVAKKVCLEKNCNFWVFEEGYYRPHFITLEKDGVNNFSPLPKEAEFYLPYKDIQPILNKTYSVGMKKMAWIAIQYYCAMSWHKKYFPNYQHHRITSLWDYVYHWLKSWRRKLFNYLPEKYFTYQVTKGKFNEFFLLTLQVHNDAQVRVHSPFENMETYIEKVLESFIKDAPKEINLIIKHHPMDRGFRNYKKLIQQKIKGTNAENRVFYVFDVNLPALLRQAKGCITLNSTSGLSALIHYLPTLTLGRAHYDFKGLTHQGNLKDFWNNPQAPDMEVVKAYRNYHLSHTQLNGSFYTKMCFPDN